MDYSFTNNLNLITAVISAITAFIAWMTYKSQKMTQENTRSLVKSDDAIKDYMNKCFRIFWQIECFVYIERILIENDKFDANMNKALTVGLHFDIEDFNNSLFYKDENSYMNYSEFKFLLMTLNKEIELYSSADVFSNKPKEYILGGLNDICNQLYDVYNHWYIIMISIIWIECKKKLSKDFKYRLLSIFMKDDNNVMSEWVQNVFEERIINSYSYTKEFIVEYGLISEEENNSNTEDVIMPTEIETNKTIITEIIERLDMTFKNTVKKSLNDNINYLKKNGYEVDWQHYILHMITNDKRKKEIKRYLDIQFSLTRRSIEKYLLFNQTQISTETKSK